MNKAILIGRLGQDPELKELSGTTLCNLSIATSERKKVNGEWTDGVEWHRVTLFGKTAENAARYLSKGSQCAVEGRIQTRTYEKDGEKRYATEIIAFNVEFIGSKGEANQKQSQPAATAPSVPADVGLDDIPF